MSKMTRIQIAGYYLSLRHHSNRRLHNQPRHLSLRSSNQDTDLVKLHPTLLEQSRKGSACLFYLTFDDEPHIYPAIARIFPLILQLEGPLLNLTLDRWSLLVGSGGGTKVYAHTYIVQLHDDISSDNVLYWYASFWLQITSGRREKRRTSLAVSIVGSPVNGLANRAPSSVIVVNLLKETSWNPPLSWMHN